MDHVVSFLRGLTAVALFGVFGAGALLVSPVMLLLRDPVRGHPVVRATWRIMVALFRWTRLIRVECGNLSSPRGSVLVANHPSLIDVVLLVALVPRTLYVAKGALRRNFFLGPIVRATALPDDATLPAVAAPYLKAGWNVLIFPEGTRTPSRSALVFHRGAAQLALRAGAPVVCIRETLSRRILAKRQPPWDMGTERVVFSFEERGRIFPSATDAVSFHASAVRLTDEIQRRLVRTLPVRRDGGNYGIIPSFYT